MNARNLLALPLVLELLLHSAVGLAGPEGWHESLDDGLAAARKSGKPLLVITTWKDGI